MLISHYGGANLLRGKAAERVRDVPQHGHPLPAPQRSSSMTLLGREL